MSLAAKVAKAPKVRPRCHSSRGHHLPYYDVSRSC